MTPRQQSVEHTEAGSREADSREADSVQARGPEPGADAIAVVGMGCRLPGGIDTPSAYWQFLLHGREAVGELPAERWRGYEGRPGAARALRRAPRRGAFLDDAAGFDAAFFQITPREAELMDPQQRLTLEASWEALEDAGIAPHTLAGGDTGVFMGVGSDDYGRQMLEDLPSIEAWSGIGASLCAVANRVSYALDLRGPSLIVDTACSSSLAALHLACQALRAGECPVALAGGVQLVAGPGLSLVLDAAGATSRDGRSKSFDAAADGYGRGEGVGVLVLKRLDDALRDGDPVRAVIRGSALRQDGRTNGIMAPNGAAQEEVARAALRQAGADPLSVGYVEAHGTGTRLGDPVELGALARVFGAGRPDGAPCLVGSAKANIGHLEAGAGVAGVIKAVLALEHGVVPPTANVTTLNPDVDWASSGLDVPTRPVDWPALPGARRAGVSSFGYGGTVGHVVLEQAPGDEELAESEATAGPRLFALSGAGDADVRAQAGALAEWLRTDDGAGAPLDGLAHTLLARRSHAPYRATAVAADRAELLDALDALAADTPGPNVATGRAPGRAAADGGADPVWVFSGHGSQWTGMGRQLLATEPEFAAAVDSVEDVFRAELGVSPRAELLDGAMTDTSIVQPMIFVVQLGLDAVLRARGLRPGAVVGHSVGEIAAAVSAGVLTAPDAARLICRRSLLLRRAVGAGAMAMVGLAFDDVRERLAGRDDVVAAIAAAPRSTVVSGTPEAVAEVSELFAAEDVMVRRVNSDVAFHSPQMDPLAGLLAAACADLTVREPQVPLYSTALDDPRDGSARDGAYWAANLRNPVRLDAAVGAAAEDGHRVFVELSGHPVVTHSIGETLEEAAAGAGHGEAFVTGTLRRDRDERATLLHHLGALHCHGALPEPAALAPAGPLVALPRRAWQHTPYWRTMTAAGGAPEEHDTDSGTLLGAELSVAGDAATRVWRTRLDHGSRPYPGAHPIHGVEVVPAAVLLHTFLAAGGPDGADTLADVRLKVPVTVTDEREIQVVRQDSRVSLASRRAAEAEGAGAGTGAGAPSWTTHTVASLAADTDPENPSADLHLPTDVRELEPEAVNRRLRDVGVADVGFPWVFDTLTGHGDALRAVVRALPEDAPDGRLARASLLDAVFSVAPLAFPDDGVLRMPAAVARVRLPERLPERVAVEVVPDPDAPGDTTHVRITDAADGSAVGALDGLRFAPLEGSDVRESMPPQRLAHALDWRPAELAAQAGSRLRTVALVGDPAAAEALTAPLRAAGLRCRTVPGPAELAPLIDELGRDDAVLVLPHAESGDDTGTEDATGAEDLAAPAWRLASVAQLLLEHGGALPPRLWAVTSGAWQADHANSVPQSATWGLTRVIAGEHPELHARALDLDADAALESLADVLRTAPAPEVLRLTADGPRAARLVPWTPGTDAEGDRGPVCRADGTYLITGGLGVLGLEVAAWLAGRGARRIVLAGRNSLPPRASWDAPGDPARARRIAAVRQLEALGVTVRTVAVDVADPAAAAAALDTEALGLPPVRGVVHAAGVLDDRMLADLDEASLRAVLRPKAAGALVLDALYPPGSVDFFVLFSSCGKELGLTGQSSYAAANSCLDALARHRRARGDEGATSYAWTSWSGAGMGASDAVAAELADHGVGLVDPAEALRVWEHTARGGDGFVAVLPVLGACDLPVLSEVSRPEEAADDADPATGFSAEGLEPKELYAALLAEVARQIEAELGLRADQLDVERPLSELGLDSVMTQVLRRGLEKRIGLKLPATLVWKHPTAAAVAGFLAERVGA